MALQDSLNRIGSSLRELEKICIDRENDVKARQQDLFGAGKSGAAAATAARPFDTGAVMTVLDRTIERIEKMLGKDKE